MFLLVLSVIGGGAALGVVPFGGIGELTVNVVDQNGGAASGQEVQILDPDTGQVIASTTTDEDGEAEFTLDQGDYEIVVGDSTQDIELGDETNVDITVDLSPSEPDWDDTGGRILLTASAVDFLIVFTESARHPNTETDISPNDSDRNR